VVGACDFCLAQGKGSRDWCHTTYFAEKYVVSAIMEEDLGMLEYDMKIMEDELEIMEDDGACLETS
jgi:hypothetical protein